MEEKSKLTCFLYSKQRLKARLAASAAEEVLARRTTAARPSNSSATAQGSGRSGGDAMDKSDMLEAMERVEISEPTSLERSKSRNVSYRGRKRRILNFPINLHIRTAL